MAEDRGPELAAVLGLFLGLTWLFVSLRMYVKAFLSKSWGADDFLLIVSLIFFTTYAACSLSGVKYGTGRHVQNIPLEDVPRALYFWWLCELFYTITTVFVRLSIAVFLLRIAVKPLQKGIIYGTLAMVVVFSIFYFLLVVFQCHPVSFFWGQYEDQKGWCIDPAAVPNASIAHSAMSFVADWILGLLPIFIIYHLQMNFRTKVSVAGILSLGLLAGIATIIRVPYIKVLALTDDFLFATTDVAIWSTVEPGLGIVAAGAATLRPLFRSFYALSTRNKTSTPNKTASRLSKWRNSHSPYLQTSACQQILSGSRYKQKYSVGSSSDRLEDDIQLRSDVGKSATVTNVRSPFAGEETPRGDGMGESCGGIQVRRTVEIRMVDRDGEGGGSVSSIGSENVSDVPGLRPGTRSSVRDIV